LLGGIHTAGRKIAVHGKLLFCCHRQVEANGFLHVRQNGVLRYRDSKGSEDAIVGRLRCETAWVFGWIPTFRRNILSLSSGLKMQAVCFFEVLVYSRKSTEHYNPEDKHRQNYLLG
jgi:hypothetical protein